MPIRRCSALLPLLLPPVLALAASVVRAQRPSLDGTSSHVLNPLPFPVEVLLVHRSGSYLTDFHQAVRVEAQGSVAVTPPAGSTVERVIPLDPGVPTRTQPQCEAATARPLTSAVMREDLALGDRARDEARKQAENTAVQTGNVEAAGVLDTTATLLDDPVRQEQRRQAERDGASAYAAQSAEADLTQAALVGIVGVAFTNSAIAEHSAAAAAETSALDDMLARYRDQLNTLENAYRSTVGLIETEAVFNESAAHELEIKALWTPEVPVHPKFGRQCTGAANNSDLLALQLPGPAGDSVLIGRARFDHGREQPFVFRRIGDSQNWTAMLYWPTDATRAHVQLRAAKGWVLLGEASTERPSLSQQVADAKKTIGALRKRRRVAAFAANGGDEARTVVVP